MANVVTDFLFGEEPSTETIKTSPLSPEKKKLMNKSLIPYLEGSATPYDQPIAAGASGLQNLSLQGLENLAGDVTRFLNPQQGGEAASVDPEFESYFSETIGKPLKRQFEEDILPAIGRQYSGQSYGSERAELERRAARDFSESLAGERSKAIFGERDKARSLLFNLLEAGAVPRGIEQDRLTAGYNEFIRQQNDATKRAEIAAELLREPDVENTIITNEGSQGVIPGILEGVAGGIAGGFGSGLGEVAANFGESIGGKVIDKFFPSLAGSAASSAAGNILGPGAAAGVAKLFGTGAAGVGSSQMIMTPSGPVWYSNAAPAAAGGEIAGGAGAPELAGGAGADVFGGGAPLSAGATLALNAVPALALAAYGLSNEKKKKAQFKPEKFAQGQIDAAARVKEAISTGGNPLAGLNIQPQFGVVDNEESSEFGMPTNEVVGIMIEGNDPSYFFSTLRQSGLPETAVQLVWDRITEKFNLPKTQAPGNAVRGDLVSLVNQMMTKKGSNVTPLPKVVNSLPKNFKSSKGNLGPNGGAIVLDPRTGKPIEVFY